PGITPMASAAHDFLPPMPTSAERDLERRDSSSWREYLQPPAVRRLLEPFRARTATALLRNRATSSASGGGRHIESRSGAETIQVQVSPRLPCRQNPVRPHR